MTLQQFYDKVYVLCPSYTLLSIEYRVGLPSFTAWSTKASCYAQSPTPEGCLEMLERLQNGLPAVPEEVTDMELSDSANKNGWTGKVFYTKDGESHTCEKFVLDNLFDEYGNSWHYSEVSLIKDGGLIDF